MRDIHAEHRARMAEMVLYTAAMTRDIPTLELAVETAFPASSYMDNARAMISLDDLKDPNIPPLTSEQRERVLRLLDLLVIEKRPRLTAGAPESREIIPQETWNLIVSGQQVMEYRGLGDRGLGDPNPRLPWNNPKILPDEQRIRLGQLFSLREEDVTIVPTPQTQEQHQQMVADMELLMWMLQALEPPVAMAMEEDRSRMRA